jgi:hypothetical protein
VFLMTECVGEAEHSVSYRWLQGSFVFPITKWDGKDVVFHIRKWDGEPVVFPMRWDHAPCCVSHKEM